MSGEYVIKIIAQAGGVVDRHSGRYLESYDPDHGQFIGGNGTVTSTAVRAEAQRFASREAAVEFWGTQYGTREWDGRANRPLTAYTIEVLPA